MYNSNAVAKGYDVVKIRSLTSRISKTKGSMKEIIHEHMIKKGMSDNLARLLDYGSEEDDDGEAADERLDDFFAMY